MLKKNNHAVWRDSSLATSENYFSFLELSINVSDVHTYPRVSIRIEFPFSHTEGIGINCCSLGSMPFLGDVPLPYTTFNRWQRYFLAKVGMQN